MLWENCMHAIYLTCFMIEKARQEELLNNDWYCPHKYIYIYVSFPILYKSILFPSLSFLIYLTRYFKKKSLKSFSSQNFKFIILINISFLFSNIFFLFSIFLSLFFQDKKKQCTIVIKEWSGRAYRYILKKNEAL